MSRRRPGRERARRRPGAGGEFSQLPFAQLRNPYPPFEIVSKDEIEAIHEASLTVLEEIGVNFLLPEARAILAAAGAQVQADGPRVRFDRALIEAAMATAPAEFTLRARNPNHDVHFGANSVVFASVSSPPNVSDIEAGRRTGNYQDFCDLLRLTQVLNIAHMSSGHGVEPVDIDPAVRHLDATLAMMELTDKAYRVYSLGRDRVLDNLQMTRILHQVDDEALAQAAYVITFINSNSPLQYDVPMLWGMIEFARCNQPVAITPFTLAGAMAPVTLAGALTQQNAEALAGLAFVQMVRPGCPVMYGGFTSIVDMKTGSPAFGTPEAAKTSLIGAQLARRYRVPYRNSNVNSSNAPDVQSAYESQMSIWSAVMGHTHLVHHGLGWLEGGLCT